MNEETQTVPNLIENNPVISKFQTWIEEQTDVLAVGIVGSHARGEARIDSDVDIMVLTQTPDKYLTDQNWVNEFGEVKQRKQEDWGLVQAVRTFYEDGLEVEYCITTKEWANVNPLDPGTKRVVGDGMRILYDKDNLLKKLQNAANN
jgi:predicted nucleotidyltransferase